jgi:hypothetical protein
VPAARQADYVRDAAFADAGQLRQHDQPERVMLIIHEDNEPT